MKKSMFLLSCLFFMSLLSNNAMTATLAQGWTFEDGSEMSRVSAWGGAKVECSDEFAATGKQSLKAVLPVSECGIVIRPDITDWTPYEELRFTVHNPQPSPNTKIRIMYVNDVELDGNCSISWGGVQVAPESSKTFSLKVASLNANIDRKNITTIQLYKGSLDTVFYIDDIRLYTKEEIQALEDAKVLGRIKTVMDKVAAARKGKCSPQIAAALAEIATGLDTLYQSAPKELSAEQEYLLFRAGDAATLAAEIDRRNAAKAPLTLVGAYPTERIFRDMELPRIAFDGKLAAARNEAESFQIVALPSEKLSDVSVAPSAPKGAAHPVPAKWVTINPVGYVEVLCSFYYPSSRTGFWPDILVHNQLLTLENRLQPYYVTVRIPCDAPAGKYQGCISFSQKGRKLAEYTYSLDVKNVTLPVKNELKTFVDFRYEPSDSKIRRKCYDTLFDNRLQPISMYINGETPNSPEKYQFVPHLDDLEYCISRGQNMICLWYLINSKQKDVYTYDEEYRKTLAEFINYARPIMKEKGVWDMCFISGFDEIMHQDSAVVEKRLADAVKLCTWIKNTLGNDVKIANVGRKMRISPTLMDYYYMLSIPRRDFMDIVKAGKHPCFYWVYDDPSPMLDLPGMACRILAWRAFREGAEGIGYYSTYRYWALDCPPEKAPTGVDWTRNDINIECYYPTSTASKRSGRVGDGNLFYPDRDGSVLISTRVANMRDGIEDYELFSILKKRNPNHPLLKIEDSITTLSGGVYTKDQRILDARRKAVLEAIENSK